MNNVTCQAQLKEVAPEEIYGLCRYIIDSLQDSFALTIWDDFKIIGNFNGFIQYEYILSYKCEQVIKHINFMRFVFSEDKSFTIWVSEGQICYLILNYKKIDEIEDYPFVYSKILNSIQTIFKKELSQHVSDYIRDYKIYELLSSDIKHISNLDQLNIKTKEEFVNKIVDNLRLDYSTTIYSYTGDSGEYTDFFICLEGIKKHTHFFLGFHFKNKENSIRIKIHDMRIKHNIKDSNYLKTYRQIVSMLRKEYLRRIDILNKEFISKYIFFDIFHVEH
jgi:hypothetical protein